MKSFRIFQTMNWHGRLATVALFRVDCHGWEWSGKLKREKESWCCCTRVNCNVTQTLLPPRPGPVIYHFSPSHTPYSTYRYVVTETMEKFTYRNSDVHAHTRALSLWVSSIYMTTWGPAHTSPVRQVFALPFIWKISNKHRKIDPQI